LVEAWAKASPMPGTNLLTVTLIRRALRQADSGDEAAEHECGAERSRGKCARFIVVHRAGARGRRRGRIGYGDEATILESVGARRYHHHPRLYPRTDHLRERVGLNSEANGDGYGLCCRKRRKRRCRRESAPRRCATRTVAPTARSFVHRYGHQHPAAQHVNRDSAVRVEPGTTASPR